MKLKIPFKGTLMGRVVTEALPNGESVYSVSDIKYSEPDPAGLATALVYQRVGNSLYFDAAGFNGRTVGLPGQNKRTAN
jgi:hypothetical protein